MISLLCFLQLYGFYVYYQGKQADEAKIAEQKSKTEQKLRLQTYHCCQYQNPVNATDIKNVTLKNDQIYRRIFFF